MNNSEKYGQMIKFDGNGKLKMENGMAFFDYGLDKSSGQTRLSTLGSNDVLVVYLTAGNGE